MSWDRLFTSNSAGPLDRHAHRAKRIELAHRQLAAAGWSTDRGLLGGSGMYKIVDGVLLYATNLDGDHPVAGEYVFLGFFVQNADGEWVEDEDSETEEFPTISSLLRRTADL